MAEISCWISCNDSSWRHKSTGTSGNFGVTVIHEIWFKVIATRFFVTNFYPVARYYWNLDWQLNIITNISWAIFDDESQVSSNLVCERFMLLVYLFTLIERIIVRYHQVNHIHAGYDFHHFSISKEWLMTWLFHSVKPYFFWSCCVKIVPQNTSYIISKQSPE